jgi:hydrogenase maturation protein HypF
VIRILRHDLRLLRTSSCGRLFDAAAALTGLCLVNRFEAEAAMRLEQTASPEGAAPYATIQQGHEISFAPALREIVSDIRAGAHTSHISARFHATLADALARATFATAHEHTIEIVCLSGGCFLNAHLSRALSSRLESHGLTVYRHERVSPGDGGIALGQAAIAACSSASSSKNRAVPARAVRKNG